MSEEPKVKTMQDEMNEEWTELFIENMDKLIPKEWNDRIQEVILPKILYFLKMALKKGIKDSQNLFGKDKFITICNLPMERNGEVIYVPHGIKFRKDQLLHEFALKPGEEPEAMISYLDIYDRIDKYTTVKEIIADMKSGDIFKGLVKSEISSQPEQKQIESPKE